MQKNRITNKNFEGLYLSPGHPNVNKYLIRVFKELVQNYDIDGLHLDYVRYHDSDYGKNPYAIANFKKYNHTSGFSAENNLFSTQPWNDYLRKSRY